MKHTFGSVSFTSVGKKDGGRALKGNYILVSKSMQQLELKAQRNAVQPISHYFTRQRCSGSFSFILCVCVCTRVLVRLCVFAEGQEVALYPSICVCILFVDLSLAGAFLHFREQRQCLQLQWLSFS